MEWNIWCRFWLAYSFTLFVCYLFSVRICRTSFLDVNACWEPRSSAEEVGMWYLSLIISHPHHPQPCTAVFKLWELSVFTSPQVLWSLNLDPQLNFMIKHIWRYIFKLKLSFKNWYQEESCSLGLYLLLWHGAIQTKAVTSIVHWVLTIGQAMCSMWHGTIQTKALTSIVHWMLTTGQAMRSVYAAQ